MYYYLSYQLYLCSLKIITLKLVPISLGLELGFRKYSKEIHEIKL